jgi:hypothetical protein
MTDKEAFIEFAKGATFLITAMAVIALVIGPASTWGDTDPPEKFKVVDTYGTCAVVRYTDKSNNWHYFLDCGNQHLEQVR